MDGFEKFGIADSACLFAIGRGHDLSAAFPFFDGEETPPPVIYHLPSDGVYTFDAVRLFEGDCAELERQDPNKPFAFYNSSLDHFELASGVTMRQLMAQGRAAADQLRLVETDVLTLSCPLNHRMGMGYGVLAALESGAAISLPVDRTQTIKALTQPENPGTILITVSSMLSELPQDLGRLPGLRGGLLLGTREMGDGQPREEPKTVVYSGVHLTPIEAAGW